MDTGKVFLGGIFLLVALYIFLYESSPSTKMFGGGVLGLLGLLTLYNAFKKKEKSQEETK